MTQTHKTNKKINMRSIALPVEHGGWGFLLEPTLLGLLLAPTFFGVSFGLSLFFLFLTHQPLRIAVKDHRRGRRTRRTQLAEQFAVGYLLGAIGFGLLLVLNLKPELLAVMLAMAALVAVQASYDFRNKSRELIPEITGALALGGAVAFITLLGDWPVLNSLALWGVIAARTVSSIVFVRVFFRKQRGKPASTRFVYSAHFAALLIIVSLAALNLIPYLTIVAFVILLMRAYLSLNTTKTLKPVVVGVREMLFGLLVVVCVALGFWLGL